MLIPFVFFPAQIGIVLIAGLACFIYFSHRRLHPTHARFLKSENTHFAVTPDEPMSRELDHPAPRLLTKGDPE